MNDMTTDSMQSTPDIGTGSSTVIWRHAEPASNCLLIINKGPDAVKIPREGKSWDLMEIYFAKTDIEAVKASPEFSEADHVVFESDRNMRKFAIIKRAFELNSRFFEYDALMMLDDDLTPTGCTIADVFGAFLRSGFRIGQPALAPESYWSHGVLLQNRHFKWRRTNFVEVMCPIMTMAAFKEYLPLFDATISAYGLDDYWSTREWREHGGLIVLDSTPLRHTRPVRGGTAYQGLSPGEERYVFAEQHELREYRRLTLGGEPRESGAVIEEAGNPYLHRIAQRIKSALRRFGRRASFITLLTYCFLTPFGRRVPESRAAIRRLAKKAS